MVISRTKERMVVIKQPEIALAIGEDAPILRQIAVSTRLHMDLWLTSTLL